MQVNERQKLGIRCNKMYRIQKLWSSLTVELGLAILNTYHKNAQGEEDMNR